MKKIRESNIELLRIVAMFLIVASHYSGHIVSCFSIEEITFNRIFNQLLCAGGGIGNILFFLISGYFYGILSKKRLFTLWLEVLFYSIIGFLASHIIFGEGSLRLLIAAVFPIIHGEYWFITSYFMLMLLMPCVSILINNMDKDSYQKLLFWMFIFSSIIPTIPGCPTTGVSELGFYLFVYLLGLYIRKYANVYIESTKCDLLILSVCLFCIIGTIVCFDLLGKEISVFAENAQYFGRMRSPFVLFFSLSLFNLFKKMKLKNSNVINYISGSALAVYLLHANKNIREHMWEIIFKNVELNSPFLFGHMLIAISIIFGVSVLIDILRRELIEHFILKWIDNPQLFQKKKLNNIDKKDK